MEFAFLLYMPFCGGFENSKLHSRFIYKACETRKISFITGVRKNKFNYHGAPVLLSFFSIVRKGRAWNRISQIPLR
jgi:hypothetical protein